MKSKKEILDIVLKTKGWLTKAEAELLYDTCVHPTVKHVVEIGAFLGRSTIAIAGALSTHKGGLISIDPHAGSPENQFGKKFYIEGTYNKERDCIDTYPVYFNNIKNVGVDSFVTTMKMLSTEALPLIMKDSPHIIPFNAAFIDGSHKYEDALEDLRSWSAIIAGPIMCHDYINKDHLGPRKAVEHFLKENSMVMNKILYLL
jgi:hypothetical protein